MGEKIQFGELEFSTITDTENPGVTITESLARIFECTAQVNEYAYSRMLPTPLSCENGGVNTGEKTHLVGYMLFCKHNREAATEVCLLALGLENHNYWNFDSSFYLTEGPEPVAGLVLFYPRGDSPAGLFQVFGPFQML